MAVYNAADSLRRSVGSLLSQTLSDIQVICIDDGSTDGSLRLLRSFAERDRRVEVIALGRNTGAANARNEGLKRANGDYVTFLDSDDWLAEDALQQAVEVFGRDREIDCVLLREVRVYPGTGEETPQRFPDTGTMTGREAFRASLTWAIHGLYVVKSGLHKRFPYDASCRAYSDDNTTRLHYLNSRKVGFCSGTYYYVQSPKSVTRGVSMLRFEHVKANESMKRQLQELHADAATMALYETQRWLTLIDTYMFYFRNRRKLSAGDRRGALSEMRRIWGGIETGIVDRAIRRKFGYIPCRASWLLFRAEEEIYFALRVVFRRGGGRQ